MKKKSKKSVQHPWYKRKRFLHFDFALKKPKAFEYVSDKKNIAQHNFSPLIHYTKTSRQYKRNKKTRKLHVHKKSRNIFYASHVDGYVYSYCNYELSKKYEEYLKQNGLTENVIAYRQIDKNGQGASNIHFSKDAFEYIRSLPDCNVMCLDITGFFDNLNVDILKKNWCRVYSNGKSNKLDDAHYNVFRSLKNFHYIEENDVIRVFGKEPRKRNKVDKSNKAARTDELNQSLYKRICNFSELKQAKKSFAGGKGLVRRNSELRISGIPQGTAISGLLSNIFMIDFDIKIKSKVEKDRGFYRRYSDDIFIAFPKSVNSQDIDKYVEKVLKEISSDNLRINPEKTEKRTYGKDSKALGAVYNENGQPAKVQYLGFTFDGEKIHIRSSSISKNRSKISYVIRKNKKRKNKQTGMSNINTRKVYKAQSPRKITPFDKQENKGFVFYAKRAKDIQASKAIGTQVKKNDRFIKNKISEERKK